VAEANVAADAEILHALLPPLDDHAIYVFLQVSAPEPLQAAAPKPRWDEVDLKIAGLLPANVTKDNTGRWIPPAIAKTLVDRYGAKPVWTKKTIKAGNDLHPHLTRLVCGGMGVRVTLVAPRLTA